MVRGLALVLMLIYHLAYDLVYFDYLNINIDGIIWMLLGRSSLILFLLVLGVGMSLRGQREEGKQRL